MGGLCGLTTPGRQFPNYLLLGGAVPGPAQLIWLSLRQRGIKMLTARLGKGQTTATQHTRDHWNLFWVVGPHTLSPGQAPEVHKALYSRPISMATAQRPWGEGQYWGERTKAPVLTLPAVWRSHLPGREGHHYRCSATHITSCHNYVAW